MSSINEMLVRSIKGLAKERGVTVKQTLVDCNINHNFIYDLERGKASPSVDKIARIAEYFGVRMSKLLGEDDSEIEALLSIYESLSQSAKASLREYMQSLITE